jgi:hypothetical protein
MGRPPPPLSTQDREPPSYRPGNNNLAPDIGAAFRNQTSMDDGINISESFSNNQTSNSQPERSQRATRPEMKGPSDINDILSGLKTKTINIQEENSRQTSVPNINDSSTISISDLKELQADGTMPKRTKRRQKSDKNTVSLDI